MTIRTFRVVGIFAVTAMLLLIPLVAMQFTQEVNWSLFDFVAASILLLGAGFACEMILRRVKGFGYRLAAIGLALLVLIAIWVELAVGIFGSPIAGS